jgi:hypothetical protein
VGPSAGCHLSCICRTRHSWVKLCCSRVAASVSAVPIEVDLPVWIPSDPPPLLPPARTAQWSKRIGVPAAIFLGRIRPQIIGALVGAVFIPVGAVRALIIGGSSPTATDEWGPADAFIIIAVVAGLVILVSCIRNALNARTDAAHSAHVVLSQGNAGVTQAEIAPLLFSTARFDRWMATAKVPPFEQNPAASDASLGGSRLMFARATRGHYSLWVDRFGLSLAQAFRATRVQAWTAFTLITTSVALGTAAEVASLIARRAGHPAFATNLSALTVPVVSIFALGWALGLFGRFSSHGRYAICTAMLVKLAPRDPTLNRRSLEVMFMKPYLYDMWVLKHPLTGEPT